MYLHGSFINQQGDEITVYIVTNANRIDTVEIGGESAGVSFADNPVEINSEVNDTFDHLLRHSASIRLLTENFIPDFFCTSARDAVVNIYRNNVCLFAGYIEPQTYSQPYNEKYDEVELNCIDALSALQYSKFKNVGSLGVLYNIVKSEAQQSTFYQIMAEILNGISQDINILDTNEATAILYDGSKAINNQSGNRYNIFAKLSISELLFLGNEEDDVWQQDAVIEEIMRYLNLHIVQDGFTFYIFSWETVKSDANISWRNIINGQTVTTVKRDIAISNDNAADCDTTISIGEVYNQILLTCDIEGVENIIESPLDDNLLTSPYDNKQKYCTEYSVDGRDMQPLLAFKAMCRDQATTYGAGRITNWYVRVMNNPAWIFPKNGGNTNLIDEFCASGLNQQNLPNWLATHPGAAIVSIGSVDENTANGDNSPVSKISMTNCLIVAVNGNKIDNDENNTYPSEAVLKANAPYAKYIGSVAGGNFSPSDERVTHYVVLSGKVILNPVMDMTDVFSELHNASDEKWERGKIVIGGGNGQPVQVPYWWHDTVPSRDNGGGRYYTRRYWKATHPNDDVTWDENTDYGLIPYSGKGPELYEFKYSAIGDSSDKISKIAVLACMLIIGDKCVVETGTQGQTTDFEWRTYKTREQCADDDEYYQQSFTIGFDPKIGDKLIGTEFDLQNNINYRMGIDAEGIAIPITKGDHVSGQVQFMILGPVNTTWDEITRRHPTFFRHTRWGTNTVPLLAHISNIVVKSFEMKVYSDNGLTDNADGRDLIYMSDTREEFTNRKDDLEFKINSALTTEEATALHVANGVNLSTPLNDTTKEGILYIYDSNRGILAKPEKLYVDSYYNEYHLPRVLMEQKLLELNGIVSMFNHYAHPAMDKAFFVQGISRNLMEGRADLKIKEIGA